MARRFGAKTSTFLAVLAAGAIVGGVACTGRPASQPTPRPFLSSVGVPVALPLGGDLEYEGEILSEVVSLALRRLNASLGPLDRPVHAVWVDTGSTEWEALAVGRALIDEGFRAVVLPPFEELARPLLPLAEAGRTLVVLPDPTGLAPLPDSPTLVTVLEPGTPHLPDPPPGTSIDRDLQEDALTPDRLIRSLATYDATLSLGRVLRRLPNAGPREQTRWLADQPAEELALGWTSFSVRGTSRSLSGGALPRRRAP